MGVSCSALCRKGNDSNVKSSGIDLRPRLIGDVRIDEGDNGENLMMETAVAVVQVVASVALKFLLDMAASIPFAPGFIEVAKSFCDAVKSAYENWKEFNELMIAVKDASILGSILLPLEIIKGSNDKKYESFTSSIEIELKEFFNAIGAVNNLAEKKYKVYGLNAKSAADAIKLVIFNETDRKEIDGITKKINDSRIQILTNVALITTTSVAHGMQAEREELRAAIAQKLPSNIKLFAIEIQRHNENFVTGSRAWLTTALDNFLNEPGDKPGDPKLFWLKADAGMGKSAFASMIVTVYGGAHRIAGYFFCRFNDAIRTNGRDLIMSLAAQIAENFPECREAIEKAVFDMNVEVTLINLMTLLVENPLKDIAKKPPSNMLLVIDALDELHLQGSQKRADFLKLLKHLIKVLPSFIKVLLTSRPHEDIVKLFEYFVPRTIEVKVI